jgi:predicted flap endonuclease-1-like 5' DNA nuclease
MTKISDIEGIGSTYAQKLSGIGISTTEALLKQGATKKGWEEAGSV